MVEEVLPLSQGLLSKSWKHRNNAYEELLQKIEDRDISVALPFINQCHDFLAETTPKAAENGSRVVLLILKALNADHMEYQKLKCIEIVRNLNEKLVLQKSSKIQEIRKEIFSIIADGVDTIELATYASEALHSKNNNIKQSTLGMIIDLLQRNNEKGLAVLKVTKKPIDGLIIASNPNIRNSALEAILEYVHKSGKKDFSEFKNLKKLQIKDLKEKLSNMPDLKVMSTPSKLSQPPQQDEVKMNAKEEHDNWCNAPKAELLNKFGGQWCDSVLALASWKQRQTKLDKITAQLNKSVRVAPENIKPILKMSKQLLEENVSPIHTSVLQYLSLIVRTLRTDLDKKHANSIFTMVAEKLKEKRNQTAEQALNLLKDFSSFYPISALSQCFSNSMQNKNTEQKSRLLDWLDHSMTFLNDKVDDLIINYANPIMQELEASSSEIRKRANKIFAKMLELDPNNTSLNLKLKALPEAKKKNIERVLNGSPSTTNEQKSPSAISGRTVSVSAKKSALKSPGRSKFIDRISHESGKKSIGFKLAKRSAAKTTEDRLREFQSDLKDPEAVKLLGDKNIVNNAILEDLVSPNWKVRVSAIIKLQDSVIERKDKSIYEPLLVILRSRTNNFKDSNLKVNQAILSLILETFKKHGSKRSYHLVSQLIIEKCASKKYYGTIQGILREAKSILSLEDILICLLDCFRYKLVNPRIAESCIAIFNDLISGTKEEFPYRELIAVARGGLSNANFEVRRQAIELFATLYILNPDPTREIMKEMPPAQSSNIRKELKLRKRIESRSSKQSTPTSKKSVMSNKGALSAALVGLKAQESEKRLNSLAELLEVLDNGVPAESAKKSLSPLKQCLGDQNKSVSVLATKAILTVLQSGVEITSHFIETSIQKLIVNCIDMKPELKVDSRTFLNLLCEKGPKHTLAVELFKLLESDVPGVLTFVAKTICDNEEIVKAYTKQQEEHMTNALKSSSRNRSLKQLAKALVDMHGDFIDNELIQKAALPRGRSSMRNSETPIKMKSEGKQTSSKEAYKNKINLANLSPIKLPGSGISGSSQDNMDEDAQSCSYMLKEGTELWVPATEGRQQKRRSKSITPRASLSPIKVCSIRERSSEKQIRSFGEWQQHIIDVYEPKDVEVYELRALLVNEMGLELVDKMFSYEASNVLESIDRVESLMKQNIHLSGFWDLTLKWIFLRVFDCSRDGLIRSFGRMLCRLVEFADRANRSFTVSEYQLVTAIIIRVMTNEELEENQSGSYHSLIHYYIIKEKGQTFISTIHESLETVGFRKKHLLLDLAEKLIGQSETPISDDISMNLISYLDEKSQTLQKAASNIVIKLYSLMGDNFNEMLERRECSQSLKEKIEVTIKEAEQRGLTTKIAYDDLSSKMAKFEMNGEGENLHILKKLVEITKNEIKENVQYLEDNANEIIRVLLFVLRKYLKREECFDLRMDFINMNYQNIKLFMEYTQKICGGYSWIARLTDAKLETFSMELLRELLASKQDIVILSKEGETGSTKLTTQRLTISKLINSGILRLLGHDQNRIFRIFTTLLKKVKEQELKSKSTEINEKMSCLIVNCLLRIEQIMPNITDKLDYEEILQSLHDYIQVFENVPPREDLGVKMVKTVLNRLCKILKEDIWGSYELSIKRDSRKDIYIKKWIEVLLKPADQRTETISIISGKRSKKGSKKSSICKSSIMGKHSPISKIMQEQNEPQNAHIQSEKYARMSVDKVQYTTSQNNLQMLSQLSGDVLSLGKRSACSADIEEQRSNKKPNVHFEWSFKKAVEEDSVVELDTPRKSRVTPISANPYKEAFNKEFEEIVASSRVSSVKKLPVDQESRKESVSKNPRRSIGKLENPLDQGIFKEHKNTGNISFGNNPYASCGDSIKDLQASSDKDSHQLKKSLEGDYNKLNMMYSRLMEIKRQYSASKKALEEGEAFDDEYNEKEKKITETKERISNFLRTTKG